MPVAGGIRPRPDRATGTLMYLTHDEGKRLARSQVNRGKTAPASSQ